jgi:hypothetical protein
VPANDSQPFELRLVQANSAKRVIIDAGDGSVLRVLESQIAP